MLAADRATRGLGMSLDAVGPGTAVLSMTVTPEMTNGHDTCHGGFIFTLADSAFAFAATATTSARWPATRRSPSSPLPVPETG
jgi:acyl-CoA thioesterase